MARILSLLTFALAVGTATAAAPPSSYGVAFSDGLGPRLDPPILANAPVPSYSVNRWAWGTVPETCYTSASKNYYCNVYDIEVYDVTYSDCAVPWTFCRCNNATMTATKMFDNAGRTPVRARQWVRYYQSWTGSPSAYSTFSDLTFFGDVSTTVFYHENSHNLDFWVAGAGLTVYSGNAAWAAVVAKDTCVPDNYAKSTYTEDYAQTGVIGFYNANIGDVNAVQSISCMSNQFNSLYSQLYSTIHYVAGTTCNQRLAATNTVCMGQAARDQGGCNNVPVKRDLESRGGQTVNVIEGIEIIDATFDGEIKDLLDAKAAELREAAHSVARRSVPIEFQA